MPILLPAITKAMGDPKHGPHRLTFKYDFKVLRKVEFKNIEGDDEVFKTTTPFVPDALLRYHSFNNFNYPKDLFRNLDSGAPTWCVLTASSYVKKHLMAGIEAIPELFRPSAPWPGGTDVKALGSRLLNLPPSRILEGLRSRWSFKLIEKLKGELLTFLLIACMQMRAKYCLNLILCLRFCSGGRRSRIDWGHPGPERVDPSHDSLGIIGGAEHGLQGRHATEERER